MWEPIRRLGYRAALVLQDGATPATVPWWLTDTVLFIGGTTAWKLGDEVRAIAARAHELGRHLHMGRVNTRRRLMAAAALGCQSVDGTLLVFDRHAPLDAWLDVARSQLVAGL